MSCLQLHLYIAWSMTAGRIWSLRDTYIIVLLGKVKRRLIPLTIERNYFSIIKSTRLRFCKFNYYGLNNYPMAAWSSQQEVPFPKRSHHSSPAGAGGTRRGQRASGRFVEIAKILSWKAVELHPAQSKGYPAATWIAKTCHCPLVTKIASNCRTRT